MSSEVLLKIRTVPRESLAKLFYKFDSGKFDVLARHEMHHHLLVTKHDGYRENLEDILSVLIAIVVILGIKNRKVTETIPPFQDEEGFSESRISFLLLCSKRLETRPTLISNSRRKSHLVGLDNS